MKCSHCRSLTKKLTDNMGFCSFCDMTISFESHKPYELKGAVDHVDAAKSTRELKFYHTYDLLLFLRFCREERRFSYDLMQTINRVKGVSKEFANASKEAFEQYDFWTKKTRVAESLINERIGTIPKAVTNNLLQTFYTTFQEASAPLKQYA
jgi:hypothetical protein